MNLNKLRIGIMGGSFNPIHNAHLLVANEVLNQAHLDKILFIPSANPPQIENKTISTSNKDRMNMVKLAIKDNPDFVASNIELKRGGTSYTYDTIKQLHHDYPLARFYLIMGTDEARLLPEWYKSKELLKLTNVIVVNRGSHPNDIPLKSIVESVQIPRFDISSTMIRDRMKKNQSIRYLVPNSVRSYIKNHHLYLK